MEKTLLLLGILYLCPAPLWAGQQEVQSEFGTDEGESIELLASLVQDLGLGEESFVIGSYLTEEQNRQAQESLLSDTYPGTIKFASGDVVVVTDEKTRLVLAIYQRLEEVHTDDVKQMVGRLMTRFGEPTSMAHGKLIYWAFGAAGKIEESTFNESKDTGKIEILATVKFSSTHDLNLWTNNDETEQTGTIYYIITSDRLLSRYITNQ